jgi:hypothetical protein
MAYEAVSKSRHSLKYFSLSCECASIDTRMNSCVRSPLPERKVSRKKLMISSSSYFSMTRKRREDWMMVSCCRMMESRQISRQVEVLTSWLRVGERGGGG